MLAFGGRIVKTTGSTTVKYYFGMGEYKNGSWDKLFIPTPAGVVEWDSTANGLIFKSNDHLVSARVMTDSEVWSETGGGTKTR